MCCGE
jgi:hypothetical protein